MREPKESTNWNKYIYTRH